jgi:maltose/moltooligosaccharide transporter
MNQKPRLSFWQIWNISVGFLGVQFGFALQNANVSRILSDLGADLESLSLFWLVAPIMGLIIQPIVGAASDRTWGRLGRRRPYLLAGALAAFVGMLLMPNAPLFVAIIPPMVFGAMMLALMDASFNVAFQPFRALVSDMVPAEQRNIGYSVQSLLINIGAVVGSLLPFVLTNVIGLENTSSAGHVAPSVMWAFYLGATVLLGSVLWTVIKTKEYEPEQYYAFRGESYADIQQSQQQAQSLTDKLAGFWQLMLTMPLTMKRLAIVQFFSWFALFIMWVYTMPAIAQQVWGIDKQWFDPHYIESIGQIPDAIQAAKGAAGDWVGILFAAYSLFAALFSLVLSALANRLGRKLVYSLSLALGGLGYIAFHFVSGGEMINVNLLITQVTVPEGAVWLCIPMIGVGIAWSAILAMPYAILAGALPASKTGVYMGIFNFTIAAPQIVSGILAGWILSNVFDNNAVNVITLAGISMLCAAIAVFWVKEHE